MENNKGITDELIDDIVDTIKILNNINDTKLDNLLEIYTRALCTNILIKTNRRIFPPELKYVVIDLVGDKLLSNKDESELQSIQSMSEFDRSVNFGVSNPLQAKLNLIAQKQLDDNEKLINHFKLLYKI